MLALGVRIGALGEMIAAAQPLIEARQPPPPMTLPSPETEMVFRDLDEFEAEWPEEPSNPEPRQDEVLPGTEEWVSG